MKEFVFGQAANCDVRVDDPYVSSRHARVWSDDDGAVWVEDLGSTNGTYLGERREIRVYGKTRLRPGDVLWLGLRTRIPWTAEEA